MSCSPSPLVRSFVFLATLSALGRAEDLGDRWGTELRERAYYRVVELPIPDELVVEAGAIIALPDGRMAIGTRHGDLFLVSGVDEEKPEPEFQLFATGLDEIFGLAYRDGAFYVTQSCELTRITDTDGDGRADDFEVISDAWGYANYHEYAFGTEFDEEGNLHVALGLSESYYSRTLFRGWVLRVTPEGETIPIASGLRSPGGIGPNEHGQLCYVESQGPWNSSCSLKVLTPGSFQGHPVSYNWYPFAPIMGSTPIEPVSGSRLLTECERISELVPYAVVFPYIRMGRSITGFTVDRTGGAFGPFEDQLFVGDFSLSLVMRATMEQVDGVWQGACYPFREGLSTGILDAHFTPGGRLLCGGTNRGWPVRGIEPFALERIEWTGVMPFEIERIRITPRGFELSFTKPVDSVTGSDRESYAVSTFTHIYHGAYGGPEVDRTTPEVQSVTLSEDGRRATIELDAHVLGHVHEFDLAALRSADGEALLHRDAYYTVNRVPREARSGALEQDPRWLQYEGGEGPGSGKRIVLVAAEQEYRSEESLPMLARLLSTRYGFDCTVLFALNADGLVDPSQKIRWEDEDVVHDIPGLGQLEDADLVIWFSRLLTLPGEQLRHLYRYLDSGKPLIGLRTANHGFLGFDYEVDGQRVRFGEDILGGSFRSHHGNWHQDSTRGLIVEENAEHPVLRGVTDVWGPSDVYRTYPEDGALPADCTPLLLGQPLLGRQHDDAVNPELEPLPVAWTKTWTGRGGEAARVFHSTMGSARDFESAGLRRVLVNAVLWCLELEDRIDPTSSVELVGPYAPHASGFDYAGLGIEPRAPSSLR
jgi:type 1 glutamine amidotransferase